MTTLMYLMGLINCVVVNAAFIEMKAEVVKKELEQVYFNTKIFD